MNVQQLTECLPLQVISGQAGLDAAVAGGYVADLLSNVMGHAQPGSVWVTLQGHPNIVAVASLLNLAAIIVAGGVRPEQDTVAKANAEGVVILVTSLSAFEMVGRLYQLGIHG